MELSKLLSKFNSFEKKSGFGYQIFTVYKDETVIATPDGKFFKWPFKKFITNQKKLTILKSLDTWKIAMIPYVQYSSYKFPEPAHVNPSECPEVCLDYEIIGSECLEL